MLFVRGIGLAVPCPVPASGVITVAANIDSMRPRSKKRFKRVAPTLRFAL